MKGYGKIIRYGIYIIGLIHHLNGIRNFLNMRKNVELIVLAHHLMKQQ